MKLREVKRDALGRRTDKVKPRERAEMKRLELQEGLSDPEIAKKLIRDSRTVRKHLAKQGKGSSNRTTVPDTAAAQHLIQKWQIEVASYSPTQLLQRWLDEASAVALSRFFTNKDTKMLYLEARRPHLETFDLKRLYLQVESDPTFGSLQQKFPASSVWTAVRAWGEQLIPYLGAFGDMLDDPESAVHSALDEEGIDDSNLSVFITRCRMERLYAVLLTCDLLARGLAALPGNVRLEPLGSDLEKLRLRVNLELSSLTRHAPKGGWSSGIKDICGCSLGFLDPLEETRTFLNELVKLQSTEDSLAIALQELESKI